MNKIFIIIFLSLAAFGYARGEKTKIQSLVFLQKNPQFTLKKLQAFAYSKAWLKLLHYKKGFLSGYKSQVDSRTFFLAPQGKTDPFKELRATIELFLKNPKQYSRFPARYDLICAYFEWDVPRKPNNVLRRFMRDNRTASISVAFSSYYMNSPASIFGHLFMKLENKASSLLDTGIDFTADTSGAGTFKFFFGGLTGYFDGKYSVLPFHKKLREYNDFENRDVWLYYLKLSKAQRAFFIKHLWELQKIKYDYFFLTENCAYHILSAIEAVLPQYDLTDQTGSLVIPVQTLRILVENKLVTRIEHKPSLRNIFVKSYSQLAEEDKTVFHHIIEKHKLPKQESGKVGVKLLDSLIDYYNFKFPAFRLDRKIKKQKQIFNFKRRLYRFRAVHKKNKFLKDSLSNVSSGYPPHMLHDSIRATFFSGYHSRLNTHYLMPEIRFVFHDLCDPMRGYPSNAAIEFLKLSAYLYKSKEDQEVNLLFNNLTFLEYTVLNDFSFFKKDFSWSIFLGAKRFFDPRVPSATGTFAPEISYKFGLSTILIGDHKLETDPSLLLFALLKMSANYSANFSDNHFSIGAGPVVGFKFTMTERMILLCESELLKYVNYSYSFSFDATLRYQIFTDFALDLHGHFERGLHEYRVGLMFYL